MIGKKIIAVFITATIALSSVSNVFATGQYYLNNEYIPISKETLEYIPADIERADEIVINLTSLASSLGNENEIESILDELYGIYIAARDGYSLAHLQSDKEYLEENRQLALKAADDALIVTKKLYDAVEIVYNSEYIYVLNDMFGEENVSLLIESIPSDKMYELSKIEEELVSEYEAVYSDSDACAKLFLELVKIRNEIAVEAGYDNYAEYANERVYYRDYSDEEIEDFRDGILTYYRPLLQLLMWAMNKVESEAMSMSEEDVISSVKWVLSNINQELAESFDYMIDNDLYDISFSDKKSQSGGAYTIYINGINVPYIFISPRAAFENSSAETIETLLHESGHYAALLNDPINRTKLREIDVGTVIDTAEIHSQGLEMLSMPYYGKLFGRNASSEKIMQLAKTVSAVVDGMMLHDFQTRVFEEKELTVEKINQIATELFSSYYGSTELSPEEAQIVWTAVPHNFSAPMYYLAYSVSGAAALGILAESVTDYDTTVHKYMQLSAKGAHVTFNEAMEFSKFERIFSDETAKKTVYELCEMIGASYSDLDYEAWYMDYFYYVSNIFDGRSETEFEPENNITRGEFVEAIGKMYDYYVGDGTEYTVTFDDVDINSEEARYIAWAETNGIIEGYSETKFGMDDEITREQLIAVLYRLYSYEGKLKGKNTDVVKSFNDYEDISIWANEPMAWAVDAGIINGRDYDMIVPQGNTTRAEATKIAACYIQHAY